MWIMIVVQTINGLDMPGHGPRKLPAPKMYVAIVVLWSIFGLIADAGQGRAAKVMAWAAVVTAMVIGNAGNTITGFLKTIALNYGAGPFGQSQQQQSQGATTA